MKEILEKKRYFKQLVRDFNDEVYSVCKKTNMFKVLGSDLFGIARELYESINNGILQCFPDNTFIDVQEREKLKGSFETAYSRLQEVINRQQHVIMEEEAKRMDIYSLFDDLNPYRGTLKKYIIGPNKLDFASADSANIRECFEDLDKIFVSVFFMYSDLLVQVLASVSDAFYEYKTKEKKQKLLIEAYYQYARKKHKDFHEILEERAAKLKTQSHKILSAEEWGKLCDLHDGLVNMIIEYVPGTEPPVPHEIFREVNIVHESNYAEVLRLYQRGIRNERLFCFEKIFSDDCPVFEILKDRDCVGYFIHLILDYEIIRCEMFPNLKKEFEERLNDTTSEDLDSDIQREPAVLFTPEAMEIWKKLQDAGYINSEYKTIITKEMTENKFTVIASIMGDILNLPNRWKPFETLWEFKNMSVKFNNAVKADYYPGFYKDMKELLK